MRRGVVLKILPAAVSLGHSMNITDEWRKIVREFVLQLKGDFAKADERTEGTVAAGTNGAASN